MAAHFKAKGIPVPEVYAVSEDGMTYIQEDIGDDTLFKKLKDEDPQQLLCKAVRLLPDIQFKGAEDFDFAICHPTRKFDRRLVLSSPSGVST